MHATFPAHEHNDFGGLNVTRMWQYLYLICSYTSCVRWFLYFSICINIKGMRLLKVKGAWCVKWRDITNNKNVSLNPPAIKQLINWIAVRSSILIEYLKNSFSKIPCLLCNPKTQHRFHKSQPLALNLSQMNPVWNYLRSILILSYSHIKALVF
jgi:hypothetical protein